jgi:hypothetical protein
METLVEMSLEDNIETLVAMSISYSPYGLKLFSRMGSPHRGNFCVPEWWSPYVYRDFRMVIFSIWGFLPDSPYGHKLFSGMG